MSRGRLPLKGPTRSRTGSPHSSRSPGRVPGRTEPFLQRHLGRQLPTHTVNAASGRGRRRAQVHPIERGSIGVPAHDRSEQRLAQRRRAAVDVASEQIRVVRLGLPPPGVRPVRAPGPGNPARTARSAPPSDPTCPRPTRSGRGSSPITCAARRAPVSGRPRRAGLPGRTVALDAAPPPPRPRSAPLLRTCRPRGPSPSDGKLRRSTAPARRVPSRPCTPRGPASSAPTGASPARKERPRPERGTGVATRRAGPLAPGGGRSATEPDVRCAPHRPSADLGNEPGPDGGAAAFDDRPALRRGPGRSAGDRTPP